MYVLAVITTGILPFIEQYQAINSNLKVSWITTSILIYPLTGYVLDNKIDITDITPARMIKLWLLNIVTFGISLVMEYKYITSHPGDTAESNLLLFVLVNATVIFITVKYITLRVNFSSAVSKWITRIGGLTFGIIVAILKKVPLIRKLF